MRLQPFAIAVVVLLAGAGFALLDSEAGEVVDPSAVPIDRNDCACRRAVADPLSVPARFALARPVTPALVL